MVKLGKEGLKDSHGRVEGACGDVEAEAARAVIEVLLWDVMEGCGTWGKK